MSHVVCNYIVTHIKTITFLFMENANPDFHALGFIFRNEDEDRFVGRNVF